MQSAIILDSFSTTVGKVFIIDFLNSGFSPRQGGVLVHNGISYNIKPYGIGKHDYFEKGILYPNKVWSCQVEHLVDKQNNVDLLPGDKVIIIPSTGTFSRH